MRAAVLALGELGLTRLQLGKWLSSLAAAGREMHRQSDRNTLVGNYSIWKKTM